jgi:hypothetical protein
MLYELQKNKIGLSLVKRMLQRGGDLHRVLQKKPLLTSSETINFSRKSFWILDDYDFLEYYAVLEDLSFYLLRCLNQKSRYAV